VHGGLGGGVGVGHGLVVGAGGCAWSVLGGLCGGLSICGMWGGGGSGRCEWVRGGLGEAVGGWQERLVDVCGLCGRVRGGLSGGVGFEQRHICGAGGGAIQVQGLSVGVSASAEAVDMALVVGVGGCAGP